MDIKRAKQEVKNSIEAYLSKDEYGQYRIPAIRQRPVFLIGPPGIGKTQIMEQIAKECQVALVSYTITHHTRQSAVGLPFIKEKVYGGKAYSVTEYTMSEIIASIYEKMEQTGLKEGILFIDEINCVSETLAPTMLQFLQGKTFGNQKVPDGWVIVAAGNPPEYNKSVREFDVVTLDRIKKIDVETNFEVWKEYAYKQGIHSAVISYLELRKENFYRIETTVDGKYFATARGWEDLSQLIQTYEYLGKTVDREVVLQYIQHQKIAKDFANYLELYYKYKKDYGIESILDGHWEVGTLQKIRTAQFDEHLSIISLLSGKLGECFKACCENDNYVQKLYDYLLIYKQNHDTLHIEDIVKKADSDWKEKEKSELLTRQEDLAFRWTVNQLEQFAMSVKGELIKSQEEFEKIKELFDPIVSEKERESEETSEKLENVFHFMEDAFGESQEMVAFITELNANYYSMWFIKENGCDLYFRYNKGLLFDERQQKLVHQMDEIEEMLNFSLK